MDNTQYLFNSRVDYGDIKDEIVLTNGQDIHLAAIIRVATSYAKLDDMTKFDLHKIASALGFADAEQFIFSIHALSHLFVALMTNTVDLANGLNEKLGPIINNVGNSIKMATTGAPAWSSLEDILVVAIAATNNSMQSKPLCTHPAVDPSRYN
jgi:hypothetical protein